MDASFLAGLARGLSDEIGNKRAETRKREDAELQRRQQLLENLWEGVMRGDVEPEHYGQILKDQMAVGQALSGPRKRKGGVSGFVTGESEDLSAPLGGILDELLSGRLPAFTPEGEPQQAQAPAAPSQPLPMAPPPEMPSMGGTDELAVEPPMHMGGASAAPAPFNPPRFIEGLNAPGMQAIANMPAPIAPPPRRSLLVDKGARGRREQMANAGAARTIAGDNLNERIRQIEASPLDPEQKAAAIAATYGAPASVGTTQEGGIIPDTASPTGFSQVIWGVRNGKVQETGRIPAPAPKSDAPASAQADFDFLNSFEIANGKPFNPATATPAERQKANAELARQKIAGTRPPSGSGSGSGSDADLVATIIRNPEMWDQLTPTVRTRIAPKLEAAGFDSFGKPMGEKAVRDIADFRSSLAVLNNLKTLVTKKSPTGPLQGIVATVNPWADARKARAHLDLVRQIVGKALEDGVLRKEDEEKYKRIIPNITDTYDLAMSKLSLLEQTINDDIGAFEAEQRAAGRRTATGGLPTSPPSRIGGAGPGAPQVGESRNFTQPDGSVVVGTWNGKAWVQ